MFIKVADLPGKAERVGDSLPAIVARVRHEVDELLDRPPRAERGQGSEMPVEASPWFATRVRRAS